MERYRKCGIPEKGETLPLKVTVKDAAGNPMPDMPFNLSRGDGYTRSDGNGGAAENILRAAATALFRQLRLMAPR